VPRPPLRECLLWIGLAMTASILLLAMTRHLTQDVAPVPFLWVVPLSIYLLSFILCFDAPRYYSSPRFPDRAADRLPRLDQVLDEVGMPVPLLVSLIWRAVRLLHGLSRRAGAAAAAGAPPDAVLPDAVDRRRARRQFRRPAGAGDLQRLLRTADRPLPLRRAGDHRPLADLQADLALAAARGALPATATDWRYLDRLRRGTTARGAQLLRPVARRRRDEDEPRHQARILHGRINHGEQFLAAEHRRHADRLLLRRVGVGQALLSLPTERPLKIGILGLGAGTLATYGRSGDEMRMYEINEQVLDLARSEFSYLGDSRRASCRCSATAA
jgi:hypothetical protein